MEGDTPSFRGLIANGLNEMEHPNWGSWGGRYELFRPENVPVMPFGNLPSDPETRPIWTNAIDLYAPASNEPLPSGLPGPPAPKPPAFEVKDKSGAGARPFRMTLLHELIGQ